MLWKYSIHFYRNCPDLLQTYKVSSNGPPSANRLGATASSNSRHNCFGPLFLSVGGLLSTGATLSSVYLFVELGLPLNLFSSIHVLKTRPAYMFDMFEMFETVLLRTRHSKSRFLRGPKFSFEILHKKKCKNITKNNLLCVKHEEKNCKSG